MSPKKKSQARPWSKRLERAIVRLERANTRRKRINARSNVFGVMNSIRSFVDSNHPLDGLAYHTQLRRSFLAKLWRFLKRETGQSKIPKIRPPFNADRLRVAIIDMLTGPHYQTLGQNSLTLSEAASLADTFIEKNKKLIAEGMILEGGKHNV